MELPLPAIVALVFFAGLSIVVGLSFLVQHFYARWLLAQKLNAQLTRANNLDIEKEREKERENTP